jgi:excisionase family DNA binding protein
MKGIGSALKTMAIEDRETIQAVQNAKSEADGRQVYGPPKHNSEQSDSVPLSAPRLAQDIPRSERYSGASNARVDETATASKRTFLAHPRLGQSGSEPSSRNEQVRDSPSNLPMTVQEAARFLGGSPQTVYLWVERKQIPHFRVMGRNIRFLKSDLKPFRDQFKQEVENDKTAQT